jgi:Aerobic-type carbon monoxide dehydrogenase, middle subunit CoxM/CutM homologs
MYDFKSFYQAADVDDAIRALKEDPAAILISGGSDVLIKIREGKLAGCPLVSIHGIRELKGVRLETDGSIVIGPAATFSELTHDEIVNRYIPVLGQAVDQAGGPQLRNIGTVGGNICNGATSADSASSLFLLNARLVLKGENGIRTVLISEFYTGPGRTVREQTEVLVEIRIPRSGYEGFYGHYIKYGKRNAMEIATLGCACGVTLSADKKSVEELRLAYGVAAPTPIRCGRTEELCRGMAIGAELYEIIGRAALEEVNPRSSWRASKEFRLQLVEELAKRALKQAICFAGGDTDA